MKQVFGLVLASWLFSASIALAASGGVTGTWKTADDRALIEIYHCGVNICGRVAWLRDPCFPAEEKGGWGGKPRTDRKNPSPELRNRSVIGLQIMEGFTSEGDNCWVRGSIYDAETGSTYRSRLTLPAPNRLVLHGYIGIPLFGRSSVWTRQN